MHKKIDSLIKIGESKHLAKIKYRKTCEEKGEKWNPSKAPGIYSCKTADAYRQTISEFSSWLKKNKEEIWDSKNLSLISKEVAYQYLKYRDENLSAWTVSKDMSSLNKVLDLNLNKKEANLKSRKNNDIKRSRTNKKYNKSYNPKNYFDQIELASAFGLRRESIFGGQYQVKDISLFKKDNKVFCCVIEKGGRFRSAPCLNEYQEKIEKKYKIQERKYLKVESFKILYSSSTNKLFNNYTSKIDNHSLRAKYAQKLYYELVGSRKSNDIVLYRGYDKNSIKAVSNALGHNRLDVVIDHYLYSYSE